MAEVLSIKIKVGRRELELTPDEARELRASLDKALGAPTYIPAPYPVYPAPWATRPYWQTPGWCGTVSIGAASGGTTTSYIFAGDAAERSYTDSAGAGVSWSAH